MVSKMEIKKITACFQFDENLFIEIDEREIYRIPDKFSNVAKLEDGVVSMTRSVWYKMQVHNGHHRISIANNKIHTSLNVPDLGVSFDDAYDPFNLLLETRQWLCGDEYRKERFKEMVNSLYRHRAGV